MPHSHLLSLTVFLPLVGAAVVLAAPGGDKRFIRVATLVTLVLGFLVSLWLWTGFDRSTSEMQFVERAPWIPGLGVEYHLGVDGLSLLLVLLTTLLGPLVMLGSWRSIEQGLKGFCVSLLLLQTGMIGSFVALDLFLFYVFWELMLVPLYFIVGIWGGPRRVYAAIKLFLYTLVGSLLMLIAILFLGLRYGTFDLLELYGSGISVPTQLWLFGFFALAFAIKVPMFPFHTWLPDAHVEAPTAGSVVLAGVLLKAGTYGFVRFAMPLFPDALAAFSPLICVLAVVGIIYGALVAMVQPDVKKLVAYSSVSHLGYVVLGLFALNAQGIQGGILQMVNHGLSTGALFLLVGMIYERRHTRMIKDLGGLAKVMPVYSFFFMVITFSSIGLPGLNGFVGEILVLIGAFKFNVVYGVLAALGVILGAVYMLWMFRRVFFGPLDKEENKALVDLDRREVALLSVIVVFVVVIGVYPRPFLEVTSASVDRLIERATHVQARPSFEVSLVPAEPGAGAEGAGARRPPEGDGPGRGPARGGPWLERVKGRRPAPGPEGEPRDGVAPRIGAPAVPRPPFPAGAGEGEVTP